MKANQCLVQCMNCMLRSVEDSRWRKDAGQPPGFSFWLVITLQEVLG